ncbi:alpha/beta fold hydrolase [Streptomyces sp. NPDC057445]|uniref:alpha/beta fold hydrolase n=1 Tax=Streptomyces sp. NPDC057445 TaxID=3346136 RepID=UPI0036838C28
MPTFSGPDGTSLAYHVEGEGEPLICLPGGPMRASAYFGDLGGLTAHRRLVRLDLRGTGDSAMAEDPATYRCDRLVGDVEALREHLGLDRADILAHSASGNLALLYAAAHPERVRSLTLVTPGTRALGVAATEEDWRGALALREGEPWYETGRAAWDAFLAGGELDDLWSDMVPFMYGRWDATARAHAADDAHQSNHQARGLYYGEGAFDPAATVKALSALDAPVLVLAGEYDGGPTPARAAESASLLPHAEVAVQAGAAHYPWLDDPGAFRRTVASFLDPDVHSATTPRGVRLAYRIWGEPDAPPVVLVHGRGGGIGEWVGIAEQLAATHRVYALDLRGHGLSDWPGSYSFGLFRDDLRAFITALGLKGTSVIGHSMGGVAAYLLAEDDPSLIGRLVLEDSPALFPLDPPRPEAARPEGALAFDWPVVTSTDAERNAPDPAWRERLGAITAPVLVIGGGASSHVNQEHLTWLAERIPDGRLVTLDAGHLIHETRPEEFLSAVREFGI